MGLLSSLFGSSNKNTTTSTTNATQTTNNTSADGGSVLAGDGASVAIDTSTRYSEDYRFTDSRDMSETNTLTDNSVDTRSETNTDARSYSEINYNLAPDVVLAALNNADAIDARRSGDYQFAVGEAYNKSLAFFDHAAAALRNAYETGAENLADSSIRSLDAVSSANRTDGQGVLDTVNNFGKYAALLIGAGILVALFRS